MGIDFFKSMQMDEKNLSKRKLFIGGSDINKLASGKPDEVYKIYNEKTGKIKPDDLTMVWPVIMGHITENANIEWQEHNLGKMIRFRQMVIEGKKHPFMRCTLDGAIEYYKGEETAVIDAKFTFGRPKKDEEYKDVIPRLTKYYSPQLHWNAYLLEEYLKKPVKYGLLSFIKAGEPPRLEEVKISKSYQEELIELGNYFFNCITLGFEPIDLPTLQEFIPEADLIPISMETDLKWKAFADQIIQTNGATKIYKDACDGIKKLVPPNAKECFGHGVKVKVQKNKSKRVELWKE